MMSIIFYPATVLFVDDNEALLRSIQISLSKKGDFTIKTFTNPKEAIEYLNKYQPKELWLDKSLVKQDKNHFDVSKRQLQIDLVKLREILHDKNRFEHVYALFMDYRMPEGAGTKFLEELKNLGILRVLLSGAVTTTETLNAFNVKVIDKFIPKAEANTDEQILQYIKEAEYNYFTKLGSIFIERSKRLQKSLRDDIYAKFLEKLKKDYDIVEGYLCDDRGSFLLINRNGEGIILAINHRDDIDAYFDIAKLADNQPSQQLLTDLENHNKMLFTLSNVVEDIDPKDWDNIAIDAHNILGTDLYYNIIKDTNKYGIDLSEVYSYNRFLQENS